MSNTEVFSPNKSIDASIKFMLSAFNPKSQQRMKKAIRDAGRAAQKQKDENTDAGARHVFREFIPAYILNRSGFQLEYEHSIDGQTPDWVDQNRKLIVENATFERGGKSPFLSRVQSSVASKCEKYSDLVNKHSFAFIVAVYLDFLTPVELEDCYDDRTKFRPMFDAQPTLRGLLFFAEEAGGVRIPHQPYGFMCLTNDATLECEPNWHIPTFMVGQ